MAAPSLHRKILIYFNNNNFFETIASCIGFKRTRQALSLRLAAACVPHARLRVSFSSGRVTRAPDPRTGEKWRALNPARRVFPVVADK